MGVGRMDMAVSMAIAVVVLVEEGGTYEIQGETNAAYYEHQLWVFDVLQEYEALNGLQEYAQTKGKEEGTVEESAKKLRTCPAKREILR